jgi:hypothetical protein
MDTTLYVIFEVLKIAILPVTLVLITRYAINKYMEFNQNKRQFELRKQAMNETLAKRLHAYERMILFLERISPASLVMRVHKPGMSSKFLQAELVKSIREEFEHNLAQQIYISPQNWEMVRKTKDEMIHLVSVASGNVNPDASGADLAQMIFSISSELGKLPTYKTIDALKKEIQQYF